MVKISSIVVVFTEYIVACMCMKCVFCACVCVRVCTYVLVCVCACVLVCVYVCDVLARYTPACRPYCEEERVKTVQGLCKIDEKNAPQKPQDPEIANVLKLVSSIFQVSCHRGVLCRDWSYAVQVF
jgi:hypothetical protein